MTSMIDDVVQCRLFPSGKSGWRVALDPRLKWPADFTNEPTRGGGRVHHTWKLQFESLDGSTVATEVREKEEIILRDRKSVV